MVTIVVSRCLVYCRGVGNARALISSPEWPSAMLAVILVDEESCDGPEVVVITGLAVVLVDEEGRDWTALLVVAGLPVGLVLEEGWDGTKGVVVVGGGCDHRQ